MGVNMKKVVLIASTALLVFLAPSALQAHADLTSSNPADGSALDVTPSTIELTFSEELLPDTVEIALTTESAGLLPNLEFTTQGNTVLIPWDQTLPGDTYQVAYRVVSNDGHPITGAISFSYPTAVTADAEPTSPEASSPDASSPEPVSSGEATSGENEAAEPTGINPIWIALVGLLIGAAIGFFMWRRGAKRTDAKLSCHITLQSSRCPVTAGSPAPSSTATTMSLTP